jgi:glycosyltransferase involved in cell wall biosynthesis
MNPLVSILIPVYNRVNLVGETIDSAINQTYKNIEIIIVDNLSNDGTWELLQKYTQKDNRIRIFQNTENIGPVRNWKRCIDEAKGEYAKILFSDDLISIEYIQDTIDLLNPSTAFVLTGYKIFDEHQIIKEVTFSDLNSINTKSYHLEILFDNKLSFPVSPGAALFRTKDLKLAYQEDIILNNTVYDLTKNGAGADLLLFLMTSRRYKYIGINNQIHSFFRAHKDSISIKDQNIILQYEFTKVYFIDQFLPHLMKDKKTNILLKSIKDNYYKTLVQEIKSGISLSYICIKLWKKLIQLFQ